MASTKPSTKVFYLGFLPLVLASVLCFAACTESAPGPSSNRYRYAQSRSMANSNVDTWCIAKPSTEEKYLRNNIDFGCTQLGVDCSPIARDGSCFYPNTTYAHASVVMNLHFKAAGKHAWDCYFNGTGLTTTSDPSVGDCIYEL
ncbi:major pollen allergen Ole e 10-like [Papaver somniferum]|nr:major pollen allergen Ole e 10-like [Papaver somniferum]